MCLQNMRTNLKNFKWDLIQCKFLKKHYNLISIFINSLLQIGLLSNIVEGEIVETYT